MTNTEGCKNMLQLAKPVPKGSGEATGSLTFQTKFAPCPSALERSSASRPVMKQIPLAAGTLIEGPSHRIRMKAASGSGWVGPTPATAIPTPTPAPASAVGISPVQYGMPWIQDRDGWIYRRGPKFNDKSWDITLRKTHHQKK